MWVVSKSQPHVVSTQHVKKTFGMVNFLIDLAYCQVSTGLLLYYLHMVIASCYQETKYVLHILISYWLMHHPMFIVLLNEVCQDFANTC